MFPGHFVGEINGQLVLPPTFHLFAPAAQRKLIEAIRERAARARGEASDPGSSPSRPSALAEAKRRGWRVVK